MRTSLLERLALRVVGALERWLPDALIWASAKTTESMLITRNTRDYPAGEPDVRFPYTL